MLFILLQLQSLYVPSNNFVVLAASTLSPLIMDMEIRKETAFTKGSRLQQNGILKSKIEKAIASFFKKRKQQVLCEFGGLKFANVILSPSAFDSTRKPIGQVG